MPYGDEPFCDPRFCDGPWDEVSPFTVVLDDPEPMPAFCVPFAPCVSVFVCPALPLDDVPVGVVTAADPFFAAPVLFGFFARRTWLFALP